MEGSSGRYPGAEGGPRDAATEALCRRARDRTDKGRVLALRALRRRHHLAAVRGLLEELRRDLAQGSPEEALGAVVALGELRDTSSIPAFIELLVPASAPLAIAAQQALVALAAQDFGSSQRRWSAWWHRRAGQHRIEWLIDGMGHADTEIRAAAGEELRQISGVSFEFSPELPKASREKAQQWARAWWAETGRARFGGGGGTSGSL
jgi:HEAT repeat protein